MLTVGLFVKEPKKGKRPNEHQFPLHSRHL